MRIPLARVGAIPLTRVGAIPLTRVGALRGWCEPSVIAANPQQSPTDNRSCEVGLVPNVRKQSRSRGLRRIRIRSCRVADLAAVLALWKHAGAIPSVTDNIAALRRRLRRDRQLFLLAWDGARLVGSVIGGWDGWRASIARLAVDPAYRGRGLATVLVTRIEKRLRSRGATRIRCIVVRSNARARAFWSGAGYQLSGAEVSYVKDLR